MDVGGLPAGVLTVLDILEEIKKTFNTMKAGGKFGVKWYNESFMLTSKPKIEGQMERR